jgi:endonuclease YncB( thermonuclease family)
VVDGDTIRVDLAEHEVVVRYVGMDTPETVRPGTPQQWMGPEASAANTSLLAQGSGTVYLEKDVSETDRYGRLLRYVWITTHGTLRLVNLELLRLGVAQVATFPPDVKDIDPGSWTPSGLPARQASASGVPPRHRPRAEPAPSSSAAASGMRPATTTST